ncbi:MAG: squalene/phytoene synthase family protein, partial [Deltaproteobacteria bacterium]|nr:squalene/phytoene synthase family protein [Deltaproteobacteria bacterium]
MVQNIHTDDLAFCEDYLVRVSRTFAVNIKILTGNSHKGLLLAYLLCRIADTIEDDPEFSVDYKVQKLCEYAELFPPTSDYDNHIEGFLNNIKFQQTSNASDLLMNTVRVFNELVKLPDNMISVISTHVKEMALGMASFQEKGSGKDIIFLEDREELDRYCYFVAGTVGLMITSIFSENSSKITPEIQKKLKERSVAFGLGLQITNIAKDFYGDRERGWCYVPRSFFIEEGIDPVNDSFDEKEKGYVNAHKRLINLALTYLDEALLYTLDIPRTLIRYRLFCLWPLFMAVESLIKLSGDQNLFRGRTVKISRDDVKRIIRNTSLAVMSNTVLKHMYDRTRKQI